MFKKPGVIISLLVVIGLIIMGVSSPQTNNMNENQEQLIIETLQEGNGPEAKVGDTVFVHYTGTLVDGTKFDSSLDRGEPFDFTLGANRVIAGWEQGVLGMKVGEKRRLTIAPELAYGDRGAAPLIGPGETLLFEVELVEIQ